VVEALAPGLAARRRGGVNVDELVFVVSTRHFDASLAFYRDLIGLDLVEEWTDFGHGAVLSAGGAARVELIELAGAPDDALPRHAPFLGLKVSDVDAIHERAVAAGATILSPLQERPWGGRGFAVQDPNGIGVNVYTAYETG
jgi:catechol 2,3-dioxygenase-like lactoylglutathione lyase family enzyme